MAAKKFNPMTPNNEIGVNFGKSRRVVLDTHFGELATWVKATTAGTVVWHNSELGETNIIAFTAGEKLPIVCDEILTGATIDSIAETTTATGMYWITTPQFLKSL